MERRFPNRHQLDFQIAASIVGDLEIAVPFHLLFFENIL
jgi:hypothetical protein